MQCLLHWHGCTATGKLDRIGLGPKSLRKVERKELQMEATNLCALLCNHHLQIIPKCLSFETRCLLCKTGNGIQYLCTRQRDKKEVPFYENKGNPVAHFIMQDDLCPDQPPDVLWIPPANASDLTFRIFVSRIE